jgi:hypothetical protein
MPEFTRTLQQTLPSQTSHRGNVGRGPKGYRRPDDRIREDVSDQFTDDEWLDASEMTVHVRQGVVMLGGTVPDRQQIRRAECIACSVSGVRSVTNHLRIANPRSASGADRGAIVPPGTREGSLFRVPSAPLIVPEPPARPR